MDSPAWFSIVILVLCVVTLAFVRFSDSHGRPGVVIDIDGERKADRNVHEDKGTDAAVPVGGDATSVGFETFVWILVAALILFFFTSYL